MLDWLRWLWPWPWPWKPDDLPEPTNPVLLIPGICGTQLAVRDKTKPDQDNGNRVWVRIQHADEEYKQLWGRVDAATQHLALLDQRLEVCIPANGAADDGGLYPIDILDPSIYVPLHVVYYFHNLIWYLQKHKYVPAQRLYGFGYDFRQSNMSHLDALVAKLEAAAAAADGARVDVITHSMGGLVMRCLLAARPDDYKRLVRKWIALASPFGGAPGFGVDALMTGVQFAQGWQQYFFVERSTMHTMCSQAPAVFELLPDAARPEIWPRGRAPPTVSAVMRSGPASEQAITTEAYSIDKFRDLMAASMKGFTVQSYAKEEVLMECNPACWDISDATRAAWRGAALPAGCQFFNIFGTGFDTAYDVTYGSPEEPLADVTDIARADPYREFSWIDGDSTVPMCCAVADGLDAVERKGFFATHRGLLELPLVWESVMDYLEAPMEVPPAGAVEAPRAHALHAARSHRMRRFRAGLRPEAEARTQAHRGAWHAMATQPAQGRPSVAGRRQWMQSVKAAAGAGTAGAARGAAGLEAEVDAEDGWTLLLGRRQAASGRMSGTFVNPLLGKP